MIDLLDMHKHFLLAHLREGDAAVDYTMGNGNDTLFLSRAVGQSGRVYAFDIQDAALESTAEKLRSSGAPENYTLVHASHHLVRDYVTQPVRAGVFNLGYLPRGDHRITTMRETTMPAVEAAISLMAEDGVVLIAVYPGHEEGRLEGEMLDAYLSALDRRKYSVTKFQIINSPTSPFFFVIENG